MTDSEIDAAYLQPEWIGPASSWNSNTLVVSLACVRAAVKAALSHQAKTTHDSFQQRVEPWLLACFGEQIGADTIERNHRFLEEALELVQACGCTQSEAHQLVDYVFGRPVGEVQQEAGGVMVTLAALCRAQGISMHEAGETELARIWTKVEAIRAKQAAKPKHSPLPGPAAALAQQAVPDVSDLLVTAVECGLIKMSKIMDAELQDALVAFAKRLAAAPAAPKAERQAVLSDEQIDALMPEPDGCADADEKPVAINGMIGYESTSVDAWSKPLVRRAIRAALAAQQAAPQAEQQVLETAQEEVMPGDMVLVPRQLLKDAAESVDDYRCSLEFGSFDRKVLGRLKAAAQKAAPQAEPQHDDIAAEAGYEAAAGHLSALVDEAQRILADLHRYAIDLQEDTLGGRSERGEVPIMDLAEDWLAARPDLEPQPPQQAERNLPASFAGAAKQLASDLEALSVKCRPGYQVSKGVRDQIKDCLAVASAIVYELDMAQLANHGSGKEGA